MKEFIVILAGRYGPRRLGRASSLDEAMSIAAAVSGFGHPCTAAHHTEDPAMEMPQVFNMADRVIRESLLESDRFLDLPSDTHRFTFVALLLKVDDFGNLEGGRRLWRLLHTCTQIKNEVDCVKTMSDLQDVDLVRRYEVEEHEFWHLPRFHNRRTYTSRKYPESPWDGEMRITEGQKKHPLTKISESDLLQTCVRPSAGVGVGVGVKPKTLVHPPDGNARFSEFWTAYPKKKAKESTLRAWNKLKPENALVDQILAAIRLQEQSEQWRKERGQFIPFPSTWLNNRRWEDEIEGARQRTRVID